MFAQRWISPYESVFCTIQKYGKSVSFSEADNSLGTKVSKNLLPVIILFFCQFLFLHVTSLSWHEC